LIDALDLARQDGVVRVSMVHYNTLEEVDKLIRALDQII
jgi:selenocysteine lyase/cysteine desulfurase